ncbi:MAG: class I adenylate-forming enzyme family protein [Acidimicrobiia bacterium]
MSDHPSTQRSPALDLSTWLRATFALDPDAPFLQFEGRWYSWRWLTTGADALDAELAGVGWGDATKVGVLMRNRPEVVRAVCATIATRRCLVTLSSAIPAAKLAAEIEELRLPVVVACERDWDDDAFVGSVRASGALGLAATAGDPPYRVVVPAGAAPNAAGMAPGVAVQMLTSGTTGPPKRIDLPYRGLEHEIESTAQYSSSGALGSPRLSSGTSLLWNPLLHIGGLRGLITSLVAGRRVALLERFSVDAWAAMVREHRPRAISLVPAALAMVYDADLPRETFDGVSALFSGTAPLDPELGRQFEERYGIPVLVVYGATEFAGGVAGWTLADWQRHGTDKVGSVGRPNVGVSARVVQPDSGEELPRGEVGLLEVSAAQLSRPGWLRTTDLARMDDDDFIWIVGRADDVIVRGGFKVDTNAVRDVLASHPGVLDACVIGMDDRRLGQVPVAAVELRPGADVDPAELLAWSRERLSGYQVPVEIRVVDELPRTPSMKVSQPALRALFAG